MEEFLIIARNSAFIIVAIALFASFFVNVTLWLSRNTVEPGHEAGY